MSTPSWATSPPRWNRYTDIPAEVRERLKARMVKRQYDEIATIRRDSITGRHRYSDEIRDMHFGQGRVCRTVTRTRWAPDTVERGLVYCEAEHCVIVPTVCRNVSRVSRLKGEPVSAPGGAPGLPGTLAAGPVDPTVMPDGQAGPLAANDTAGPGELVFDPPGAGNSFAENSQPLPVLGPMPGGGGTSAIPPTVGGIPIDGGSGPSLVPPGSALDVPVGVAPIGSGTVGGGGIVVPPPPPPPIIEPPIPVIPEPATWLMWLGGLLGIGWLARRRGR